MAPVSIPNSATWLKLLLVAFALFLLWQAAVSARQGISDLYARPAIAYLEDKRFDDYEMSEEEWLAIEQSISRASDLMPDNPRYLESLGELGQVKLNLSIDELGIEEIDALTLTTESYFMQAALNRPTWPYYWGNLALGKYGRGDISSDGYSQALANAVRFGPWKDDTQLLVGELGTLTLPYISLEARRQVIVNLERGLERQYEEMSELLSFDEAWLLVCSDVENWAELTLPRLLEHCREHYGARNATESISVVE